MGIVDLKNLQEHYKGEEVVILETTDSVKSVLDGGESSALTVITEDSRFQSENSLSDDDLPLDYDEQDEPIEKVFSSLEAGYYFG